MKKIVTSMLACGAAMVMASTAVAGEREGAFSVSPFVGGYTFGGVQHLETAPVFGLRLGYDLTDNWEAEGVADFLATKGTLNKTSINALSYRLDALYNFLPKGPLVPYLAAGVGGITYGHGGGITNGRGSDGLTAGRRVTDVTLNAGGGVKYFLTDSLALRGDARQLFVMEQPRNTKFNWEYSAGLSFLFGGKPAPVAAAAIAEPAPVQKPAPEPPPAPPTPAADLTVAPGAIVKGEAAMLTWSSQNAGNCEIQPGIGMVQPQGTVTVRPADSTSYSLTCSGAGGSAKSAAELLVTAPAPSAPTDKLTALPGSIDKGQSATLTWSSEYADACQIQPGIGAVQPQGSVKVAPADTTAYLLTCSGAGGVATSGATVAVLLPAPMMEVAQPAAPAAVAVLCRPAVINVRFDTNKAIIKPQYHGELKKLADFLAEYPKAAGVIEGHTDSAGSKQANMKLSQWRAESVRSYLINKFGVAPNRIKAVGFGPTRPIADNKTKAGKERNRRIESNFTCDDK